MEDLFQFFLELDKLKSVYRRTYLSDNSRHENSAEHSWHLALAVLTLDKEFDLDVDLLKTLKMALIHDIGEIGAGDISVFDPEHEQKTKKERHYLEQLKETSPLFTADIEDLWVEYEAQETLESRWVKIIDRLLPFMMNIHTEGKAWIEQGVTRSEVQAINQTTKHEAPDIYAWMMLKMDKAIANGWLINA